MLFYVAVGIIHLLLIMDTVKLGVYIEPSIFKARSLKLMRSLLKLVSHIRREPGQTQVCLTCFIPMLLVVASRHDPFLSYHSSLLYCVVQSNSHFFGFVQK